MENITQLRQLNYEQQKYCNCAIKSEFTQYPFLYVFTSSKRMRFFILIFISPYPH